ncbi:MAG: hypothetical protein ACFHXK_17390 [bacterium]
MSKFMGLLVREWREHANGFLWAPGAILCVLLLAGLFSLFVDPVVKPDIDDLDRERLEQRLDDSADLDELSGLELLATMTLDVAGSTDAELREKMTRALSMVAVPFNLVFFILAFSVLINSLYDERKDQSILFWKSMPVRDVDTVMSKWVFVSWIAPITTIVAICLAQLLAVAFISVFVEQGMAGRIWSASQIWLRPFDIVVRFIFLSLWLLPIAGWVMFVSAWAKRLPTLIALGAPWILSLLERLFVGSNYVSQLIRNHLAQMYNTSLSSVVDLTAPLASLGQLSFWLGLVLGVALLAAAVLCRARINEG